jgi:8-amino-7-oxononanoate synthase
LANDNREPDEMRPIGPSREWPGWEPGLRQHLDALVSGSRWRHPRTFDAHGTSGHLDAVGTEPDRPASAVVSFASNDYLGLTSHPAVAQAAIAAIETWGTGSGASRLVVGSRPVHDALEAEVADWKGTDRAVLFPTGYAANLGVLTALCRSATTSGSTRPIIVSDELNHASIIDASRLAAADVAVVAHRDLDQVSMHLQRAAEAGRPAILVSDSVFSMDGDEADVDGLVEATDRWGALLVLDEAHAVFDTPTDRRTPKHVVRVTTLSKTLGSLGGVVAASSEVADLLVNTSRPYIFTTALSPADTAAGLAALRVLRSDEGRALVARLRTLVDRFRPGHPSPIVPIIVGTDRAALDAAAALLERELLVPAIRPPTVAEGTARLRVTLSAAHTDAEVDALLDALAALDLDASLPLAG